MPSNYALRRVAQQLNAKRLAAPVSAACAFCGSVAARVRPQPKLEALALKPLPVQRMLLRLMHGACTPTLFEGRLHAADDLSYIALHVGVEVQVSYQLSALSPWPRQTPSQSWE